MNHTAGAYCNQHVRAAAMPAGVGRKADREVAEQGVDKGQHDGEGNAQQDGGHCEGHDGVE